MTARCVNSAWAVLTALAAVVLIGACEQAGNGPSRAHKEQPPVGPTSAASSPREGGVAGSTTNQGGETDPTGYTDARYHYHISTPGPMRAQPDGTATFSGEDELLEVRIIEGAKAADPAALANEDLNSLSRSTSDFKVLVRPAQVTMGNQKMVKWSYSSTGKGHTGQSTTFNTVRYYIPGDPQKLAVVTYKDAANEFDAKEADGFASSFRWL